MHLCILSESGYLIKCLSLKKKNLHLDFKKKKFSRFYLVMS